MLYRDGTVSTMPVTISMLALRRASIHLNKKNLRIVSCKPLSVMYTLLSSIVRRIVQIQHRANTIPCNWRSGIFHCLYIYIRTVVCTHVLLYLHIVANDDWFYVTVWQKRFFAYREIPYLHKGEFDVSWRQYYLQNSFVTQTRKKLLILMSHFAQVIIPRALHIDISKHSYILLNF